jgi:tetratricopeptide (TPR) repeat protein
VEMLDGGSENASRQGASAARLPYPIAFHPSEVAVSRIRRYRWAVIFLLVASVVACASDEERFAEHMARAADYREKDQFKKATIELRSALKLKPANALVNEQIADLSRETGSFESALFFYREAQRLDPERIEPLLQEFLLVFGTDLERAQEIIRLALELAPDDPRVQRKRSELALRGGNTDTALGAALTAVELAPNDPASHLAVGVVYQAKLREQQIAGEEPSEEFYRLALEAFERADAGESSIKARIERARTLAGWPGHREEAEAAFQAALERAIELEDRPHLILLAEEIALRARRLGEPEREREALEVIVNVDPKRISLREQLGLGDPEPRIRQAWTDLANLTERQSPGTGSAVLERLIEKEPEDPRAHLLYARFLHANGRSDEALAYLEASADQDIEPALLLDEAVRLALESGEGQLASGYVRRLDDEQPDHVRTLLAKARMALARRNAAEAAEVLRQVNEFEESAESQRLLALAEFRLANLAAAQQAVGRSLELQPQSLASLRLQAQIHSRGGDWLAVLQTLRRLRATGARLGTQDRLLAVRPFYELGQERSGRALLDEILATDPPPEAAVVAFVRYESQRDPEKTLRLLDETLARNPTSVALLPAATTYDLRAGEIDRALGRLNRALEARPDAPLLLALRAQVLARADRLEEAERDALRAFEISPAMPNLLELILAIYDRRGRIDIAIEQLEASESAGLLGPQQRVLLGRLHLGKGNADRAQQLYEAALAEDPELAGAKNDLAFLLAREERELDRALQLAQEAQQSLGEDPQVLDTLGFVMLQRGLAGPAAEQFSLALRLAEESGGAPAYLYYHMGLALRALGQEEAAGEHLDKALSISPDFEGAEDARQQLEASRAATARDDAPAS